MSSAFRWDAKGWFGSQVGGTCWMLVLGGLVLGGDAPTGLVALGAFAFANAVGTLLWARRRSLAPYGALQALVLVQGLAALVVALTLHGRGTMEHLPDGSQVPIGALYAALLVYPLLALVFRARERGGPAGTGP